jgi:predicted RNA-binding Zn-ribbon protein involved in translation (DUF1610 family)
MAGVFVRGVIYVPSLSIAEEVIGSRHSTPQTLANAAKVEHPCPYCGNMFLAREVRVHRAMCEENPRVKGGGASPRTARTEKSAIILNPLLGSADGPMHKNDSPTVR